MKKSTFYLILFFLFQITGLLAQDISINDLKNMNVDDLSDGQILRFMDKVDESGYSEDQLILMAKSRGMSESELQKLRSRIRELGSPENLDDTNSINRLRDAAAEPLDSSENLFSDVLVDSKDDGPRIFGIEYFRNSSLKFETGLNMPTPTNYVLGAGDQLIIDVWGASEKSYQLDISPEGAIKIPNLGPIYVSGLTIKQAKPKLINRLKKIYSSIGNGSSADVSLGQIRSINVHVIGEVQKPGTYTLSSFSTAFNALYSAGGPSESGSFRKIEIFREKQLVSTLDMYEFLIRGTGDNITLQDQDLIIVREYQNRILLDGEVKRPAFYELLEGESLGDLMLYSGGYSDRAYRGLINLRRIEDNHKTLKTISMQEVQNFPLHGGDEVHVSEINNRFSNRVTIEGPVYHAGEYELTEGLTLNQLIKKADGLRGETFMDRGVIIRKGTDLSLSSIVFDPERILSGEEDIILQNEDLVKLQSIYDLREQYNLNIQGEVQKPGTYSFVRGMTVKDLIYLAGGFKESAAKSFVEVARRVREPEGRIDDSKIAEVFNLKISGDLTVSEKDSDFELEPYDILVVRRSPFATDQKVVEIEGEVNFPGKYVLTGKEDRISDVIVRAGGMTVFAYPEGATLIRRTEYFLENDEEDQLNDAVRIRKEDLSNVFFKNDSTLLAGTNIFRSQEAVGIDLSNVMDNKGSYLDLMLREGDIITLPREPQTVRVRGMVLYPSNIRYDKIFRFQDFIGQAGGFDQEAKKSKVYIIYANNSASKTKNFLFFKNYPKVRPGSEIVVPKKAERQEIAPSVWVAMASTLTTMLWVISNIAQ